jgi:hypothetical protein
MLMLEAYISHFTCASYYFLYVELSDCYVNQSLAGQTITKKLLSKITRKKSFSVFFFPNKRKHLR